MGVTTYYSVGGEIIGERTGGVRTDYLRDALGSVTATKRTDRSTLSNTYRYKPYGERLAKTGVAADPRFQWVGTAGYRETAISHSKSYVRARHLGQEEGRWTTVDPIWPWEPPFTYAFTAPTQYGDPMGKTPCADCKPSLKIESNDQSCYIAKHPVKPVYNVKIYKCYELTCGAQGSGEDCHFSQDVTTEILRHGTESVIKTIRDDLTFRVNCPGEDYAYDGPGFSDKKDDPHDPCSSQTLLEMPALLIDGSLPIIWRFWATARCKCGANTAQASYAFAFKLELDKKSGKVLCDFL